jgi:hypothetical protein
MKLFNSLLVLAVLALSGCDAPPTDGDVTAANDAPVEQELARAGTPRLGDWGIETAHISDSTRPGDDFFTFVNAGWLEKSEIPAGFSRLGSFTELTLEAEQLVNEIIAEAAAASAEAGDARQQIGDLFASYMDTDPDRGTRPRADPQGAGSAAGNRQSRRGGPLDGATRHAFDCRAVRLPGRRQPGPVPGPPAPGAAWDCPTGNTTSATTRRFPTIGRPT